MANDTPRAAESVPRLPWRALHRRRRRGRAGDPTTTPASRTPAALATTTATRTASAHGPGPASPAWASRCSCPTTATRSPSPTIPARPSRRFGRWARDRASEDKPPKPATGPERCAEAGLPEGIPAGRRAVQRGPAGPGRAGRRDGREDQEVRMNDNCLKGIACPKCGQADSFRNGRALGVRGY